MKTYTAAAKALDALGDATRRSVFELLREGSRPVGELAAALPVSRPAVSQHLRVLKDADLVRERVEGTRRFYSINADAVAELREYFDGFWDRALAAFKERAEGSEQKAAKERSERSERAGTFG